MKTEINNGMKASTFLSLKKNTTKYQSLSLIAIFIMHFSFVHENVKTKL